MDLKYGDIQNDLTIDWTVPKVINKQLDIAKNPVPGKQLRVMLSDTMTVSVDDDVLTLGDGQQVIAKFALVSGYHFDGTYTPAGSLFYGHLKDLIDNHND